eukprot:8901157-Alexandrium_andersonii.AAC.1
MAKASKAASPTGTSTVLATSARRSLARTPATACPGRQTGIPRAHVAKWRRRVAAPRKPASSRHR